MAKIPFSNVDEVIHALSDESLLNSNGKAWTMTENVLLSHAVQEMGTHAWHRIANLLQARFPNRPASFFTASSCEAHLFELFESYRLQPKRISGSNVTASSHTTPLQLDPPAMDGVDYVRAIDQLAHLLTHRRTHTLERNIRLLQYILHQSPEEKEKEEIKEKEESGDASQVTKMDTSSVVRQKGKTLPTQVQKHCEQLLQQAEKQLQADPQKKERLQSVGQGMEVPRLLCVRVRRSDMEAYDRERQACRSTRGRGRGRGRGSGSHRGALLSSHASHHRRGSVSSNSGDVNLRATTVIPMKKKTSLPVDQVHRLTQSAGGSVAESATSGESMLEKAETQGTQKSTIEDGISEAANEEERKRAMAYSRRSLKSTLRTTPPSASERAATTLWKSGSRTNSAERKLPRGPAAPSTGSENGLTPVALFTAAEKSKSETIDPEKSTDGEADVNQKKSSVLQKRKRDTVETASSLAETSELPQRKRICEGATTSTGSESITIKEEPISATTSLEAQETERRVSDKKKSLKMVKEETSENKQKEKDASQSQADIPHEDQVDDESGAIKNEDHEKKVKNSSLTNSSSSPSASSKKKEEASSSSESSLSSSSENESWSPLKEELQQVFDILWKHKSATLFKRAVKVQEAPDYDDLVRVRMDLSLIRERIQKGHFESVSEFRRDFLLMIANAMCYNSRTSQVYEMAAELKQIGLLELASLRKDHLDQQASVKNSSSSLRLSRRRRRLVVK